MKNRQHVEFAFIVWESMFRWLVSRVPIQISPVLGNNNTISCGSYSIVSLQLKTHLLQRKPGEYLHNIEKGKKTVTKESKITFATANVHMMMVVLLFYFRVMSPSFGLVVAAAVSTALT